MEDMVGGVSSLAGGLFFAFFHRRLARESLEFRYGKLWVFFSDAPHRAVFLFGGIAFAGSGLDDLLKILT